MEESFKDIVRSACIKKYGEHPHVTVTDRIEWELELIEKHHAEESVLLAKELTDAVHVVGEEIEFSFALQSLMAAFLLDISVVNPLPPHYHCPHCHYFECSSAAADGVDLADRKCPSCGTEMLRDGHDLNPVFFVQQAQMTNSIMWIGTTFFGLAAIEEVLQKHTALTPLAWTNDNGDARFSGWYFALPEQLADHEWTRVTLPGNPSVQIDAAIQPIFSDGVPYISVGFYPQRIKKLEQLTGVPFDAVPLNDEQTYSMLRLCLLKCPAMFRQYLNDIGLPFCFHEQQTAVLERFAVCFPTPEKLTFSYLANAVCYLELADTNEPEEFLKPYAPILLSDRDDVLRALRTSGYWDGDLSHWEAMLRSELLSPKYKKLSLLFDIGIDTSFVETDFPLSFSLRPRSIVDMISAVKLAWYSIRFPKEFDAFAADDEWSLCTFFGTCDTMNLSEYKGDDAMQTDRANTIRLLRILKEYSDEAHILPMREIIEKMSGLYGTKIDRRTVYSAVDLLQRLGYDISDYEENGTGYFLRGREFELSEVRLLMDAVYSFPYIPQKQTEHLIKKLQRFLSVHERKQYKNLTVVRRERKTPNAEIFLNIELLDEAISKKQKVSFTYLEYGFDKQLRSRREEKYLANPYGMVCENEHYYLVLISDGFATPSLFRIDLMKDIQILDEPISISAKDAHLDSVSKVTYAFVGEQERIRLRCDNPVLRHVIDRFGMDVRIVDNEDGTFDALFSASPNGVKFWAQQYLQYVEVLEPQHLRDEVTAAIRQNKYGV